jgi:hypothetical protein
MSSVVVRYPVEVRRYRVLMNKDRAEIELEGVEASEAGAEAEPELRRVGHITFGNPDPIGDKDFITRGGFLQMDRPMEMLAGILYLLHEAHLFLDGDGTLTTSQTR